MPSAMSIWGPLSFRPPRLGIPFSVCPQSVPNCCLHGALGALQYQEQGHTHTPGPHGLETYLGVWVCSLFRGERLALAVALDKALLSQSHRSRHWETTVRKAIMEFLSHQKQTYWLYRAPPPRATSHSPLLHSCMFNGLFLVDGVIFFFPLPCLAHSHCPLGSQNQVAPPPHSLEARC